MSLVPSPKKTKQSCFKCGSSSRMTRTCIAINDIKSFGSHTCNPSLDSKDGIFARRLLCTRINSESMCQRKFLALKAGNLPLGTRHLKHAERTKSLRTSQNSLAEDFEDFEAIRAIFEHLSELSFTFWLFGNLVARILAAWWTFVEQSFNTSRPKNEAKEDHFNCE